MPVSGNQEIAVESSGGQSSLDIAGLPVKKRKFIWPALLTPQEQKPLAQVQNGSCLEKEEDGSPSQESEFAAARSSGLSDANRSSILQEENEKASANVVLSNGNSDLKVGIEDPSFSIQSESLPKPDNDEKLLTEEKSANVLPEIKALGGVPVKKRRFIRPSSPPPEEQSFQHEEKDSIKEHDSLSMESTLLDACVAGSSSGLFDENSGLLPEDNQSGGDNSLQANDVQPSRLKIEEACQTSPSDGNAEKFEAAENSADSLLKSAEIGMNLAPHNTPGMHVDEEICNQQLQGKYKEISEVSRDPELPLGLKQCYLSALEDQSNDESSQNLGNIETFSLNLSLSTSKETIQHKIDNAQSSTEQSSTENAKICADRSNWDLNTTMDTWEAPVSGEGAGQETSSCSNAVGVTNDIKPPIPTGMAEDSVVTDKQLPVENEPTTTFTRAPLQSVQQYNSEDGLHLHLSPSFRYFNSQEPSSSFANKDCRSAVPSISLPRGLSSRGNRVSPGGIKSEPFDESHQPDFKEGKSYPTLPVGFRSVSVKHELVGKVGQDVLKMSNYNKEKSVDAKSPKSEPFYQRNVKTPKAMDGSPDQSSKEMLQCQDDRGQYSCPTKEYAMKDQYAGGLPACSTDEQVLQGHNSITKCACIIGSSMDGNLPSHLEHGGGGGVHLSDEVLKESCECPEQVTAEMGSLPVCDNNASETVDAATEEKNADKNGQCKLKNEDEISADACQNGEGTICEEEKINLSGDILDEDSYDSQCKSDGNSVYMDREEAGQLRDDYNDGEVCELQRNAEVEGPIREESEHISQGVSDYTEANSADLHADVHPRSSHIDGKDTTIKQPVENTEATVKDTDPTFEIKAIDDADKYASREGSLQVDVTVSGFDKGKVVKTIERKPLGLATNGDNVLEIEQSSDFEVHGTLVAAAQGTDEIAKRNDEEMNASELPKIETSINDGDIHKDANNGGNRSRIINLSVASSTSSFGKTRSISGKLLSLHPRRERLDARLERDRPYHRGRDHETYIKGSDEFSRERHQESRNSRWNFGHGRGRLASRIDSVHNDRDYERDSFPRHKDASAISGSSTEFMNYNMVSDGSFVGNVRRGRKLVDDNTSIFHQLSSRNSPGGRDRPASRGLQMVHRVPRSTEGSSDVVGIRHNEKIMRGFSDDGEQNAYMYSQPPYEGRFVQGTRDFSTIQGRPLPEMRSKSPIRSCSPGPWSCRRRSPDGFGVPKLPYRRSPIYRMGRTRSPDNPGFPAGRVRSDYLREMDPGRDHGHQRAAISYRSSAGQSAMLQSSRRFAIMHPREKPENEEFFAGPLHSGRFHELGGDGNEERRRFGERRVPVRSFRPPFNSVDSENFHLNTEDGPRSFRLYPEVDPDFHERPNLGGREFDRRIKNCPENAPRRPRSIEEQDGNYRLGGHELFDHGFDDISRIKRKRF